DNLRAAIALSLGGGTDPILAVKFEVALQAFRFLRGYSTEGRKYIHAALSMLGTVRLHEGDAERARKCDEEALLIFRDIGDRIGEAIGLGHLGEISLHVFDGVRAREYFEQCLAIAREIDHRELEGESELFLGEISLLAGDVPAARARFDRSLE